MENFITVNGELIRLQDKKNGQGEYFYNDSTRYVGMFSDDMLNGPGQLYHFDYSCFHGIFKANMKHGKGELVKRNGTLIEQVWEHGNLISEHVKATSHEQTQILAKSVTSVKAPLTENEFSDLGFDMDNERGPILNISTTQLYIINAGPETLSMIEFQDQLENSDNYIHDKVITKWDDKEVAKTLQIFGLFDYVENFVKNKIKGKALLLLNEEDMEELGITKVGEKIKLRDLIVKLRKMHQQQKHDQKRTLKKSLSPHSRRKQQGSKPPLYDSETDVIEEVSDSSDTDKTKREAKTTKIYTKTKPLSELKIDRKSSHTSIHKLHSRKHVSTETFSLISSRSLQAREQDLNGHPEQ